MKATTAGRDYWLLTYRAAKYLMERATVFFKINPLFRLPAPVGLATSVPDTEMRPLTGDLEKINSSADYYNNQFVVLYGIQPSWDIDRIQEELRDVKLTFGPFSKIIICSESYIDELVQRCDELHYDAYLLTCDRRDELKNAVRILQAGKWYLSKSVITSYCISRRKDWAD